MSVPKVRRRRHIAQPSSLNPSYMRLTLHPLPMAVCRLPAGASIPMGALDAPFCSVTHTADEWSVVLPESRVEPGWQVAAGWRLFQVAGPLDFGLTGIVAGLTRPLAEAGVPVFVLSTFDTDYLLVRADRLDDAVAAWRLAGYDVALP